MTYTFSVNNTPADGTIAMWTLITTLKAVGWTQADSADGVTVGHGDGYVTGSGTGAGGLGNTSAWIRLQAPAVNGGAVVNQRREILIQRGSAETAWRLKYSASAGFIGGSPTNTVSSTATDQVVMMGSGTDASPGYSTFFGTGGTYRWHICCGGANEFYSFYVLALAAGVRGLSSNKVGFYMDVLAAGSYPPEDVDPCVFYCSAPWASASGGAGFGEQGWFSNASLNAVATVTGNAQMRAWLGATSQADTSTTTNSVAVYMIGSQYFGYQYGLSGFNPSGITIQSPFSKEEVAIPSYYIRYASCTPPFGPKGFSTLFKQSACQRQSLNLVDVNAKRDMLHYSLGATTLIWLPWSGTPILI